MQSQVLRQDTGTTQVPPVSSPHHDPYPVEDQLALNLQIHPQTEKPAPLPSPSKEETLKTDFNYALKCIVESIAQDVESLQETLLSLNPSRKLAISYELNNLISELNEFKPIKPIAPEKLMDCLYAPYDALPHRALRIFLSRATYFTTIQLFLIHYWKDLNLISCPERNPYKDPQLSINSVINRFCTNLIAEKHNWLFAKQNNYSWYKMSKQTLTEVETIFSFWKFKPESISLLSTLFDSYLNENRLNTFSHGTPSLLVKFMWDFLLDASPTASLFRQMGNQNFPKLVFDPICGSGSFLMEAALRMKAELKGQADERKRLTELGRAWTQGLLGCDIDHFAFYFTEIKMLWLLTDTLETPEKTHFVPSQKANLSISIIHQNAFKLYSDHQLDMVGGADIPPLSQDASLGLLPIEGHLKKVHNRIKILEKFDYCIGCPPELFFKDQKQFVREIIQKIPYWKNHYEPNILYSSWFFILGLSKLREGGQLIYLSETYWPGEEGASQLRKYILAQGRVLALMDLGNLKLNEDQTSFPRYITLIEKCSSKEQRDSHKIKIIKIHTQTPTPKAEYLLGKILKTSKLIDRPGKIHSDDDFDVFFSGIQQAELGEAPWHQIYDTGFNPILKQILTYKTTLQYFCQIETNTMPKDTSGVLVTPEIAPQNAFSLFEEKPMSGNTIFLETKPICKESPHYLMALLNSAVINFWCTHHGTKKNGKKFFEPHNLKLIPIRPINFEKRMEASIQEEKTKQIESNIQKFDFKYLLANLSLELSHGSEEIVHDALVMMQKEMISLRKKLKRYDSLFEQPFSESIFSTHEPAFSAHAFKNIYPPDRQCALGQHREVFVEKASPSVLINFCWVQMKREPGVKHEAEHLVLLSQENKMIKLYAPKMLLDFIEAEIKLQPNCYWEELQNAIGLPKELSEFETFQKEILTYCQDLKAKALELKSLQDHLIFKLYGFNAQDPDSEKAKAAASSIEIMQASF